MRTTDQTMLALDQRDLRLAGRQEKRLFHAVLRDDDKARPDARKEFPVRRQRGLKARQLRDDQFAQPRTAP